MKYFLFLFFTLMLTACDKSNQQFIVNDVSKSQDIFLESHKSGNVHSLTITVTGDITGNSEIALMAGEKPYKLENITGKVNVTWGGDWYSEKATIRYTPKNASDGKLVIDYKFNTI